MLEYSNWIISQGVTGFLCSVSASSPNALNTILDKYAGALNEGLAGAEGLGFHLEGPFLSPEKKGAFNLTWLHAPDIEEIRSYLKNSQGWIKQVTIAPDLPGADQAAQFLRENHITVALGHTDRASRNSQQRVIQQLQSRDSHLQRYAWVQPPRAWSFGSGSCFR